EQCQEQDQSDRIHPSIQLRPVGGGCHSHSVGIHVKDPRGGRLVGPTVVLKCDGSVTAWSSSCQGRFASCCGGSNADRLRLLSALNTHNIGVSLIGERRPEEGAIEIERVESPTGAEVVGNVAPATEQLYAVTTADAGQTLPPQRRVSGAHIG